MQMYIAPQQQVTVSVEAGKKMIVHTGCEGIKVVKTVASVEVVVAALAKDTPHEITEAGVYRIKNTGCHNCEVNVLHMANSCSPAPAPIPCPTPCPVPSPMPTPAPCCESCACNGIFVSMCPCSPCPVPAPPARTYEFISRNDSIVFSVVEDLATGVVLVNAEVKGV